MSSQYFKRQQIMEVACNECGYAKEFYGEFNECVAQMKADGWRMKKKDDGVWVHYDDECARAYSTIKRQELKPNFPVFDDDE